ncbi:NB-ARC domain-containing protein [Corchorus capsularis]|uniref:NB-ARC domain-containing protein n=1 Tax=Corchorus capsularis TaxID=210143 RepID=A0A1R3GW52_COCAP|nr:NB-ARC domain-containing protein [Corchorus capsularis]
MALEITELLIAKLDSIHDKETRGTRFVETLERFKRRLKGAEDYEANSRFALEWKKLLPGIYSLEDYIEKFQFHTIRVNREALLNQTQSLEGQLNKFDDALDNSLGTKQIKEVNEKQATSSSCNEKRDETSNLDDNQSTYSVLDSYQQRLSVHQKWCLLYLGLFPENYEIYVRRLILLWIAEGLVTPFEEALRYIEWFHGFGMISLSISAFELSNVPKKCIVRNAVSNKTLLQTAQEVGFFHFHRSSDAGAGASQNQDLTIRRLAESDEMYIHSTEPRGDCLRHLRSYISFYQKKGKGDAPTSRVNHLLKKIIEMRGGTATMLVILDLGVVYKPVLDRETLRNLPYLKYLGLRRTFLDFTPDSVGDDLPHLQTFDIKHTCIINLPSSIWRAKKLQHLYMSEICVDSSHENASDVVLQKCMSMIKRPSATASESSHNLETLWGLMIKGNNYNIPKKKWFDRMVGLRRLKLTCREASIEVIARWIYKLKNLQSLKLRSTNNSNEPGRLRGLVMTGLINELQQLYLVEQLPKPLIKDGELPQNLEILTLSASRLKDDPMDILGKLPKLKVLRLYANSFTGQEMIFRSYGFPQLQELKSWTVEDNAMQVLKKIEIRCYKRLKEVRGLGNSSSWIDMTLTNMADEFAKDVKQKLLHHHVMIHEKSLEFDSHWVGNFKFESFQVWIWSDTDGLALLVKSDLGFSGSS